MTTSTQTFAFIKTNNKVFTVETIEVIIEGVNTVLTRISTETSTGETKSSKWIQQGMNHRCALERMAKKLKGTLYPV